MSSPASFPLTPQPKTILPEISNLLIPEVREQWILQTKFQYSLEDLSELTTKNYILSNLQETQHIGKSNRTFNERYPTLYEQINELWDTLIIPYHYFDKDVFFKLLDEITDYDTLVSVSPLRGKEGGIEKVVFYFSNLDQEKWNEIENKIGDTAHEYYLRFGDAILDIVKLIDIESI